MSQKTSLDARLVNSELQSLESRLNKVRPEQILRRFTRIKRPSIDERSEKSPAHLRKLKEVARKNLRLPIVVKGRGESFGEDEVVMGLPRRSCVQCISAEGTLLILRQEKAFVIMNEQKILKSLCDYVHFRTRHHAQVVVEKSWARRENEEKRHRRLRKNLSMDEASVLRASKEKMSKMIHYTDRFERPASLVPRLELPNLTTFFKENSDTDRKKRLRRQASTSSQGPTSVFEMTEAPPLPQLRREEPEKSRFTQVGLLRKIVFPKTSSPAHSQPRSTSRSRRTLLSISSFGSPIIRSRNNFDSRKLVL
eukprot:TRINITY_DN5375_c0_g1_i2.p1 TRINITY_DN5375_c0_g1~~TRINITY_DN5375_c0_g1_i2.p1  ORF type:complete len:309 (+),score=50.01 TRINITY_DN5375_c0_g1_i2:142-1068(+)